MIDELVHEVGDEARGAAVHLLRDAADLPQQLAVEFSRRWAILSRTFDLPAPDMGYFAVVPAAFETLLARGQLAVPGSVFGSDAGDWSAVTCLLANDPAEAGRAS